MNNLTTHRFHRGLKAVLAALLGLYAAFVLAAPTVDQSPLTIQAPIPPNIVLMLDDSGSMAWNFMPDICFLNPGAVVSNSGPYVACNNATNLNLSGTPSNAALINSTVNGVYYNPSVTYTPPVKANGTSYAVPTGLTSAWPDGFAAATAIAAGNTPNTVNLTTYAALTTASTVNPGGSNPSYTIYTGGTYETDYSSVSQGQSNVAFSTGPTALTTTTTTTQNPTCSTGYTLTGSGSATVCLGAAAPTCSSGTYNSSSGTCTVTSPSPTCPSGTSLSKVSGVSTYNCNSTPTCTSGTFSASTNACITAPAPTCPSGTSVSKVSGVSTYNCNSTPTCTSGTLNSSQTTCSRSPTTPNCPSGSSLSLLSGASKDTCNATPSCSLGAFSTSAGTCVMPTPACPTGATVSKLTGASIYTCNATPTCSSGSFSSSAGTCTVTPPAPTCPTGGSLSLYGSTYQCVDATPNCGTGFTYISSGTGAGLCSQTTSSTSNYNFFQYASGSANTVFYVASAAQGCGPQTNCYLENDITGAAAPIGVPVGQNIANWYSYYHTRILMVKSGLMVAFSGIDPTIRVGFGSINGNNKSALPSSTGGTYPIAAVKTFDTGAPTTIGGSGTQRASFWSWITGESASGGTPLRSALNAVGTYYSTAAPWQNSSTDTTELACRQSYTILTTDGFWNDSSAPNVGNVDNTSTTTAITGPNGQTPYIYTAAAPYKDSTSNTLADVAMKYWVTDLQTSVLNEVPTSTEDPAFWQHMTTFTLGLGFTPTGISPSSATIPNIFAWSNGGTAISGFSWPAPSSNSINNIADLAHAAVNGHGGFYSATSPQAFSSGIADAINRVETRVGTGASLAANSTKLATGTVTYQALYYSGTWVGDLKAYTVSPTTGAIAATPSWSASTALPAWGSRTIYTYSGGQFIQFNSPSTLSSTQQAALGSTTANQQSVINYLLGDSSNEQRNNGVYRNRTTPIGDIISSQPVYVGAPNPNLYVNQTFTGASGYAQFASGQTSRNAVLWVAANDGVLHGFEASDGKEIYGYLPSAVITSGLANLTNPNYGTSASVPHQSFNDGQLTVADVNLSSGWRTVLVGTTGRGTARAVYAIDVTNPSSPTPLWERSAGDGLSNSSYIGQMVGQPVIAQTANGTWSVLIGNGYNSGPGTAALLQFDLSSGTLAVHTTNTATSNGLAAPAVWIGTPSAGVSTTAYAGDILGNVWSFDLSSSTSTGQLLFTAKDSSGNVQPITDGLLAGKDPATSNVWVFFGTGQYLTQADLASVATQTWYGIIVQSSSSSLISNLSSGRSALTQRQIIAQTASTSTSQGGRAVSLGTAGDMAGKSGWYIDLLTPPVPGTAQGERMVIPNQFQGSLLLGTTLIPQSSDACNPSGSGAVMAINPFTGTNPSAIFFDLNSDGQFNSSDQITITNADGSTSQVASAGMIFGAVPNAPIFVGNTMLVSFNNATTGSFNTAATAGSVKRLSWRELVPH